MQLSARENMKMIREPGVVSAANTPLQALKSTIVGLIGRDRANRISAPYHNWMAQRRTREFLASLPCSSLRINLGCGYKPIKDWVNLDGARGPHVDVVWDLRNALPFSSASALSIFCEHVIEHLSRIDAERLLAECYRVLQPGGVARFSTPDTELYLKSYAGDRQFLYHPEFLEKIETSMDRINLVMREYGQHLWSYDSESLELAVRRAGFSTVVRQDFRRSLQKDMAELDSEERAFESLYIEGLK